jgi:hypothetical protein
MDLKEAWVPHPDDVNVSEDDVQKILDKAAEENKK